MRKTRLLALLAATVVTVIPSAVVSAGESGSRPNDPYVERQVALEEIGAFEAWHHSTGRGALVAVVDSGIDLTHPDLDANVIRAGKDFVDGGTPDDEFGHGTHVAGIIAAVTNNGEGVASIAPQARLMSVRILDENNGAPEAAFVPKGIRWAAKNGADVINVSVGYPVPVYGQYYAAGIDDLQRAIDYAWGRGAVVVFAAGNAYQPLCDQPMGPALCVGATGAFGQKTPYSNFDVTMTENYLVAPGGETVATDCNWLILSTWARRTPRAGACNPAVGYAAVNGTSMAAPMVAGVAALLVEQGLTNKEIVARILGTADDLGAPGRDPVYGFGRVNALRAVTARD